MACKPVSDGGLGTDTLLMCPQFAADAIGLLQTVLGEDLSAVFRAQPMAFEAIGFLVLAVLFGGMMACTIGDGGDGGFDGGGCDGGD